MMMYNLIEYTENYSEASGSLWQYYKDRLGEGDDAAITYPESFKSKVKITGKYPAAGTIKNIEIEVPLKYLK